MADEDAKAPQNGRDPGCAKPREPAATGPKTVVKPVEQKIPEGPGNLRDREDAFNKRRGRTK